MSKASMVCLVLFALLAYAGLYHLIVGDVPIGRLLIEISLVPGYAAAAFELLRLLAVQMAKRRLQQQRPTILR